MATPESEAFVRTFARGLKVIEVMGQATGSQTIADVAQASGLPRTAVRRFLMTLSDLDFVRTDGKRYWLTPKVLRLGLSYVYTLPFWRTAQIVLEELCANLEQSCAVSVLDEEDIVYVARVHARRILSMSPVLGSRLPAHAVSMGRVLLSGLDDTALKAYLATAKLK
jgi:IclR family pca regulon transcriptional regulator